MKELNINTKIKVCQYDELTQEQKLLVDQAKEATFRSYAPYSNFFVGAAALLENGEVVTGSNQENAAYPSGLCAERVTLFYANSKYPDQPVTALAIAARTNGDFINECAAPCGACRQVILETEYRGKQPLQLILFGKGQIYIIDSIKELLPLYFDKDSLG
ncbi:MAG: cytidine deaminase [Bacteroidales bacterium]|nr:cytidine deaminase [Bacteroidales bacterium]